MYGVEVGGGGGCVWWWWGGGGGQPVAWWSLGCLKLQSYNKFVLKLFSVRMPCSSLCTSVHRPPFFTVKTSISACTSTHSISIVRVLWKRSCGGSGELLKATWLGIETEENSKAVQGETANYTLVLRSSIMRTPPLDLLRSVGNFLRHFPSQCY